MNSRIQRLRYISIFSVIIVSCCITIWFYVQISVLIDSGESVNHTNSVRFEISRMMSLLKDAETGQRGFLLTGDSLFLTPYIGAKQKVDTSIARINELVRDIPDQQKKVSLLREISDKIFNGLDWMIFVEKKSKLDSILFLGQMKIQKNTMDAARQVVTEMISTEERMLADRLNYFQRNIRLTPLATLIFSLLLFSIIAYLFVQLNRRLNESKRMLQKQVMMIAQVQELNRVLEKANDELSSFAFVASHDLQEPLRKIQMFATRILRNDKSGINEETRDYLGRMQNSASRMQRLISDLLTFSRAGNSSELMTDVDLNKLLEESETNLKQAIEDSSARIISDRLPIVSGVEFQLQQVFDNLLLNSIKYKKESEPLVIRVQFSEAKETELPSEEQARNRNYYKITFEDNGIGFDPSQNKRIFELFQRLHGKNEYSGTGIGLSICKKIIENHGGFITAEGMENAGARFHLFLPARGEKFRSQ